MFRLLELVEQSNYNFILETNGILIGYDPSYARELSKFSCIHVRVSLKGVNSQQFFMLTGANPEAFSLQIKALKNLLDYGVSCHPAVMSSFSSKAEFQSLLNLLGEVDKKLVKEVEEEYVFLYPHVVERLKKSGIKPKIAYTPDKVPEELV